MKSCRTDERDVFRRLSNIDERDFLQKQLTSLSSEYFWVQGSDPCNWEISASTLNTSSPTLFHGLSNPSYVLKIHNWKLVL